MSIRLPEMPCVLWLLVTGPFHHLRQDLTPVSVVWLRRVSASHLSQRAMATVSLLPSRLPPIEELPAGTYFGHGPSPPTVPHRVDVGGTARYDFARFGLKSLLRQPDILATSNHKRLREQTNSSAVVASAISTSNNNRYPFGASCFAFWVDRVLRML